MFFFENFGKHYQKLFPKCSIADTELVVPDFSTNSLLPKRKENFYRYEGSLTTPGCDEVVVWTVMTDPITATPSQVEITSKVQNDRIAFIWKNVEIS